MNDSSQLSADMLTVIDEYRFQSTLTLGNLLGGGLFFPHMFINLHPPILSYYTTSHGAKWGVRYCVDGLEVGAASWLPFHLSTCTVIYPSMQGFGRLDGGVPLLTGTHSQTPHPKF